MTETPRMLGPSATAPISIGEYKAILRMLLARATWRDRYRAWRAPGHWIHKAKRDLLIP